MISEASVHICMALQSTEGKVSEVGMTPKDINGGGELDMDKENPLKSVWD